MTTTEDNKDQEALNVVAHRLAIDDGKGGLTWERRAARILSALSEAGYTVVKTEDVRVAQAIAAARVADRKCDWRVPESDTECGGLDG